MKTLLVFLAHPDDESFGPGATLAKYAHEGVAVHYLCATHGESGTVDPEKLNGYKSVAELRSAELACAVQELGLAGLHYLGYRDSGMPGSPDNQLPESLFAAPLEEVALRLVDCIRELNPNVILTHDQYGGYGHPDHIKCHQAMLRAYQLLYGITVPEPVVPRPTARELRVAGYDTNPSIPKLYYTAFQRRYLRLSVRLLPLFGLNPRKFGRNADIDLVQIASWHVPPNVKIDVRKYIPVKEKASECHASQRFLAAHPHFLARLVFRRSQNYDFFSRAYPIVIRGEPFERDLFG